MNRLKALLRTQQTEATAQRNAQQQPSEGDVLHVAPLRECNTQHQAHAPRVERVATGFTPAAVTPVAPEANNALLTLPDAIAAGPQPTIKPSQSGRDCGRCLNFDLEMMPDHLGVNGGRAWYQWRCMRGHSILRAGFRGADVLVASSDCNSYQDKHKGLQ